MNPFQEMLEDIHEGNPEIESLIVVDETGIPLAHLGLDDVTATIIAGIARALFVDGVMALETAQQMRARKISLRCEQGYISVILLQDDMLLVMAGYKDFKLPFYDGDDDFLTPFPGDPRRPEPDYAIKRDHV